MSEGSFRPTLDALDLEAKSYESAPFIKNGIQKSWWTYFGIFAAINAVAWPLIIVFVILKNGGSSNSSNDDDAVPAVVLHYSPILSQGWSVTGVRAGSDDNLLLTGGTGIFTLEHGDTTQAFLFYGTADTLYSGDYNSSVYMFNPTFPNETVQNSMFYGPNTPYYDPRIGDGNILAVGAYSYLQYDYQCSFIYEGPLNGTGTYTKIKINDRIRNETYTNGTSHTVIDYVANTVTHSVMGDYVVGTVYYTSDKRRSFGLIYNRLQHDYLLIERDHSTSIYGIWQNGNWTSTKYTIVGGHSDFRDNKTSFETAFIENFDGATYLFSDFRDYYYLNNGSYATHFQGITGVRGGYNLAAEWLTPEGNTPVSAFIPLEDDNSFGTAEWTMLENFPPVYTTCDTASNDLLFGVYYNYTATGKEYFTSYIYNVTAAGGYSASD